jgi:hypothetical protein
MISFMQVGSEMNEQNKKHRQIGIGGSRRGDFKCDKIQKINHRLIQIKYRVPSAEAPRNAAECWLAEKCLAAFALGRVRFFQHHVSQCGDWSETFFKWRVLISRDRMPASPKSRGQLGPLSKDQCGMMVLGGDQKGCILRLKMGFDLTESPAAADLVGRSDVEDAHQVSARVFGKIGKNRPPVRIAKAVIKIGSTDLNQLKGTPYKSI